MAGSVPAAPSFVDVGTDVLYHFGLAAAVGIGLVVAVLAFPESTGRRSVSVSSHVRALAIPAAVLVAVIAVWQFLGSAAQFAHTDLIGALDPQTMSTFFSAPPARGGVLGAGISALVQLGFAMVVAVGLAWMHLQSSRGLARGVLLAAFVTAMYPLIPWSGWTIDGLARNALTGVHVLGALLWVGGLVVLAAAGLIGRRRARTEAGGADVSATAEWMQIWERFSVVALFAVGALIVSGTWLAWSHVGTVGQLVTTTYGRYLGVKLLLVIGLMVAGAYNMRVLLPRIRTARSAGDTRSALHLAATHFPLVVLAEAVTGTGVLAIVPFLRGSARSQAGWAAARPFDLTVAGTGLVLVALVAFALWAGTRTPKAKGPAAETTARPAVDATTGAAPTADR